MNNHLAEREDAIVRLDYYAHLRYLDGIKLAIRELETVAGWLTHKPMTKRQTEHRQWVLNRIEDLKIRHNVK